MLTTVLPSKANSEPSLPWLTPPEPLSSMRSGTGIRRPETKTASSFPHPLLTRIETRKKEENSPSSPAAAKIPGSSSSHQALLAAIRVDHQTRSRCVPEVGTTSLLLTSPRRQNQLSGGCGSASSRVSRCVPTYVLEGYFWSPPGNATFPIQAPPPKNPHQRGKGEKKNTPMQQPCMPASLTLPRRLARRGASDVPPPPKKEHVRLEWILSLFQTSTPSPSRRYHLAGCLVIPWATNVNMTSLPGTSRGASHLNTPQILNNHSQRCLVSW